MDLSDNGLILDAPDPAAALALVTALIARSRNTNPSWTGPGLTSSAARNQAAQITGLAAIVNNDGDGNRIRQIFGSQQPGLYSVLVKYTYNGDSNLSGIVDASDYFDIDQGYRLQADPAFRGYLHGDFDYSGSVTADDYYLIDRAFIHETGPLAAGGLDATPASESMAMATPAKQAASPRPVAPFVSAAAFQSAASPAGAAATIWGTRPVAAEEPATDSILDVSPTRKVWLRE